MTFLIPPLPVVVNLRRLFPKASFVGCGAIRVVMATDRSDACQPGCLFAALPGSRVDGHRYIPDALRRGASALLAERPQADVEVPQCIVPNARKAFSELTAALSGDPTRFLRSVGVTGTNGKTTITWLIRAILRSAGRQTGLLGTVEYSDGIQIERSSLTTPGTETLTSWLSAMMQKQTTHVAMEISSHALDQDRTAGHRLDVAMISNVTQDHFDYHHDFETYRNCKSRIFEHLKPGGVSVLNADDPGSMSCRGTTSEQLITYGIDQPADITAEILEQSLSGSRFLLRARGNVQEMRTHLIGKHNVSNCLAAAAAAMTFGISLTQIAQGIESLASVPGRMEAVECGQNFGIFVDYAHTDDALRRSLAAVRQLTPGRVMCVFGAGGDRDRTKRPLLGKAAAEADVAFVTSDNPRNEDPERIIQDVLVGFPQDRPQPIIRVDRAQAIHEALISARPGDCVLIAGKGHETEQVCGNQRLRFDDREVVRDEFFKPHRRPFQRKSQLSQDQNQTSFHLPPAE